MIFPETSPFSQVINWKSLHFAFEMHRFKKYNFKQHRLNYEYFNNNKNTIRPIFVRLNETSWTFAFCIQHFTQLIHQKENIFIKYDINSVVRLMYWFGIDQC